MLRRRTAIFAFTAIVGAVSPLSAFGADPLPTLHADGARTSASGVSSGAYMAIQYGVAFSSNVIGLGLVAGGPYDCFDLSGGSLSACMSGKPSAKAPSAKASWEAAQDAAKKGLIDSVAGLAKFHVYLFTGTNDKVVLSSVVGSARDFFLAAGVPAESVLYVDSVPAGHAFVAADFGNECATTGKPWIVRCSGKEQAYDQPKEILQQIYGALKPPAEKLSSSVTSFDQRAFAGGGTSMDSTGYVYIPSECAADGAGCAVHVVFHGCKQGAQGVGNAVYESVGYNRWADANHLIVLYPQVVSSDPGNPNGCWDWWGYTDSKYAVRSGKQLSAVKAMVDRLTTPK